MEQFYLALKKYFERFVTLSGGVWSLNVKTFSSSTSEQIALDVDGTVNANTTASSASNSGYTLVGAQIDVSGLNNLDGSFKLQESIDGVSFVDIAGATVALNANATFMIPTKSFSGVYVRGVYAAGTNTMVIDYDNLVGLFAPADVLTDLTSTATAVISVDDGVSQMEVTTILGTFTNNDLLDGQPSGATADVNVTPTVPKYTATLSFK